VETVLNLFWLTLALSALAHWILKAQWDSPEQSKALRLTALVMLLVLLFPVISLTDDFQAAATLAEGERAGPRIAPNDIHAALQLTQTFTLWGGIIEPSPEHSFAMVGEKPPLHPSAAFNPHAQAQRPPPHADSSSLDS
jgi:hypothetical protein